MAERKCEPTAEIGKALLYGKARASKGRVIRFFSFFFFFFFGGGTIFKFNNR